MPRKKIYDRKVSLDSHRVKLYEVTDSYVRKQTEITGQTAPQIIREMCEAARLEELTRGQFSVGTTKVFQSVTNKLLKKNLDDPLEKINSELRNLQKKIEDLELSSRFADEEIFRVIRAFYVENQILAQLVYRLVKSSNVKVNVLEERKQIKEKYVTDFDTRRDVFYTKYRKLLAENYVEDEAPKDADEPVIDASQTDQSS